jgi:hypothetical protein
MTLKSAASNIRQIFFAEKWLWAGFLRKRREGSSDPGTSPERSKYVVKDYAEASMNESMSKMQRQIKKSNQVSW